jgi:excisionase family DNA binding protein
MTNTVIDTAIAPLEPAIPLIRLAYTIGEAALALSLSRSRIYELLACGEITACKIGRRTVIPAPELIAFLDRHRVSRLAGAPCGSAPVVDPAAAPT